MSKASDRAAEKASAAKAVDVLLERYPDTTPETMLRWAARYKAIAAELTDRAIAASSKEA